MKAASSTSRSQPTTANGPATRAGKPKPAPPEPAIRPDGEGDHEETIRLAAYGFYEARGRADGHALADWLAAKAQVERSGTARVSTGEPAQ